MYVRTVQRSNRASNKCCRGHLRTLRGGGYVAQVVLYNNYTSINQSSGVALVLKSIKMLRDPLDQYSEWLCNKCDFSLEVSMQPKMLGQSVYNLFFDNMTIFHLVCPPGSRLGEEDRPDGGGAQRPLRQVR